MSEDRDYDIRALFGQDDDDDEPVPGRNPGLEDEEEADPQKTVLPEAVRISKKKPVPPPEKKAKRLAEELSEMRFEKDKLKKLHEYSEAEMAAHDEKQQQSKKREPEKKKKKAEQMLPPKEKEEMYDLPPAPKEKKKAVVVVPEKSKLVPDKKAMVPDKKAALEKSKPVSDKKPVPDKKASIPDKKPVPDKKKAVPEKSKVVTAETAVPVASEEKVLPLFPHIGDMERADAMLALAVEDAWRSRLPEEDPRRSIRDEMGNSEKAMQFNERCKTFSKQLQTALITFFNERKNTALANVMTQLPLCHLCVFGSAKPIFAEKTPVCIWTGKLITEPSLVRTVSLVPKKKEKEDQAICFHIGLDFLPILKCIYTAMFFARVATAEIAARFVKAATTLEADDWKVYMQPSEKGKGGENGVTDFVDRSKRQLVECVNMLREFLPVATFLVKTA